jgi:hypothetical protein
LRRQENREFSQTVKRTKNSNFNVETACDFFLMNITMTQEQHWQNLHYNPMSFC